jgi:cytochrome c-type biogenesis protein CcmH
MGGAMWGFVIAGLVLAVLTLAYVLRPLWRTRRVAGVAVIVGLTLATAMTYLAIGTPAALDTAQREMPKTLEDAIAKLEGELQRDPNQIEGWRLLGRAYIAQGNSAKAAEALSHALKLSPDDPDLLAETAEMRALATPERRFDAEGVAMLRHAIELQPMHQRSRWFLGIAQRQASQPAEAARTWEPLLTVVDAAAAAPLREQINAARAEAGLSPLPAAAASAATPAQGGLKVKVTVAPELAATIPPNATLFVIARQAGGPPMPVAVEKLAATGFPREVVLDDGDSPMPTMKLSQLEQVQVLARVSASGNAMPQAGDLASSPVTVRVDRKEPVGIVIDRVVE